MLPGVAAGFLDDRSRPLRNLALPAEFLRSLAVSLLVQLRLSEHDLEELVGRLKGPEGDTHSPASLPADGADVGIQLPATKVHLLSLQSSRFVELMKRGLHGGPEAVGGSYQLVPQLADE